MFNIVLSIHVLCALISICFFVLRGVWTFTGSGLLQRRFVRIAPHVIDTLLLAAALVLCVMIRQYPFVHAWLTVKLLALVVYIGLGLVALRFSKTNALRAVAFVAAIVVFAFIVSVARTHNPMGFLA